MQPVPAFPSPLQETNTGGTPAGGSQGEKDSSQKRGGSRKEQGEGKPRSSTAQPAVAASGDLSGEVWRRQHQSVRSREPGGRCTEGLGSMAAKDSRDGAGGEAQVGWMWGGVLPGRVVWEQGGAYEGDW